MNPHRPISARECAEAAARLLGLPPRTKLRDTDRTTYLPAWAARHCSDLGISIPDMGRLFGTAHSTAAARANAVEKSLGTATLDATRRAVREDAIRHREGKRGSMPAELKAAIAEVAGKDARLWRERRCRLSPEWVRAIRLIGVGNCVLSRFIGMPQSQISMVRSRKIWGWVDDLPEGDA